MKSKIFKNKSQSGFTLVELLVVMSFMVMLSTVLILDFNRQRAGRNITIAKNETVTNIRKVQSYMLSSRNIEGDKPAKYYLVEFDLQTPGQFTIQGIDKDYTFHDDLEIIELPNDVQFVSFSGGGLQANDRCLQILFAAPFGTMYAYGSSSCGNNQTLVNSIQNPVQLAGFSQATTYLSFLGTPPDSGSKYVQISPLTGQILSK